DWVSEILLQDDNVKEDIDYIPIKAETIKGAIYGSVTLEIKDSVILKEDEEFPFIFSVSNSVNTYTESYNLTYDAEGPIPFSAENSQCKISLDNDGNYILTKYSSHQLEAGNTVLYDIGTVATLNTTHTYYSIGSGKLTEVCFVTIKDDTTEPKTKYVSSVYVIPGTVLEFHDAMDNITEVTTAYELESGPSVDIDAKYTNGKYWYSDNNGVTVNFKSNIGFSKCFYTNGTNTFVTYDSSITLAPESKTTYTIKAFDIENNCTEKTVIIGKDVTAPECEIKGVVPYKTASLYYRSGTVLTGSGCFGIATGNGLEGSDLKGFQSDSKTSYSIARKIDCNHLITNYNYICKSPLTPYSIIYDISILFSIKETECGIAENGIEILASDKKTVISVAEGKTFGTEDEAQTVAYCNLRFDRSSDITDALSIRVTDALGNSTTTPLYSIQIDNDGPVFKQISTTTTGTTIQKVNNTTYKIYAGSATTTSVTVNFKDEMARMFSVLYSTDSYIAYSKGMQGGTYLQTLLQPELQYTASLTSGTTYYFFGVDRLGNYTTITVQVVSGSGSGSTTITN
ncbi:MAG TPA: hypothetical protein DCF70_03140, partial [Treponema sp.]|nr:hypothetical protein [Treponema sp.]